jgi:ferredoxin-NADP reductase/MOSC domain-containing protein YiiM
VTQLVRCVRRSEHQRVSEDEDAAGGGEGRLREQRVGKRRAGDRCGDQRELPRRTDAFAGLTDTTQGVGMTGGTRVGRLKSVNVGLPRDVAWRGRTVHTGAWKEPVQGPRTVRRLNIDGDGQGDLGGHGGQERAVLAYQVDSYRHWQRHLGRDDLRYGLFGENFTVDGLADEEVCIGDRYGIGSALFEVTQPRVTCYRVGIRLGDPRIPALLVSHHRPGFYLRVLDEGQVEAGDDILLVRSGPERMTVAEIDALLYLPGHSRHEVARALRIPALSPGWQASFRALLEEADGSGPGNAGLAPVSPPPAWPGFRTLTVTALRLETPTVLSLSLAAPDGTALPPALPGQFLTLRLPTDVPLPPRLRSYSLSGPPGAPQYRISVKREPHGTGSGYLHTTTRVGDGVEVAAPRGTFTLRAGQNPVLLISAGIGATPVLAMLHALAAARSEREVWWLHGARNGSEHAFAVEAGGLLAALPNAHRHICYSRPEPSDHLDRDDETAGRLSAQVLADLDLPPHAEAYLCGPTGFLRDLSAALVAHGVAPARIRTELFGAQPALTPGIQQAPARAPHPPDGTPGDGPLVSFARSGLTVPWDPDCASLLELAEACDVPTRWSCRTGVCHSCETGLLSGTVTSTPDPVDPPIDGTILICSARPAEPITLDL